MKGFDFGQIGGIIGKYVDTDAIDIKRNVAGELQTIYTNVPCHVTYRSIDNADPYSIATKPIITTLEIHMAVDIDIRNDDYIVIKKVSSGNEILQSYSGRCGYPIVDQARKKVNVTMSAEDVTEPEPLPPSNPVIISISCVSEGGAPIQADSQQYAERDTSITIYPPVIEDYLAIEAYLDDVLQDTVNVTIENTENDLYSIKFVYEASSSISYMRLLLDGLYTKDNGSLASGYYLYKRIPITLLESNGTYRLTMSNAPIVQEDTGETIEIVEGTKMVLFSGYIFTQVQSVEELVDTYILTLAPFTPTDEEKNAYLTEWYD